MSPPDFRADVLQRLPSLRTASPQHADIVEELASQLEEAYSRALTAGLDEQQALRRVEEQLRHDSQSWQKLEAYLRPKVSSASSTSPASFRLIDRFEDWILAVRQAGRQLAGETRFAIPVVVTLSVCLGVTAAVFTIVNAVLLRPLPFPESDRVVLLAGQSQASRSVAIRSDVPSYFDRLQRLTVFDEMAMFRWIDVSIDTPDGPRRVRGDIGTPSLLRLIGVQPLHGRLFREHDTGTGAEGEVVLSHELWQEVCGGDRRIVGSEIALDGRPFTVVGIMPPGFGIFRLDARLWIAKSYTADERVASRRGAYDQYQIGRLRPGVTLDEARRDAAAFDAWETERFPALRPTRQRTGFYTSVDRLQDVMTREVRPILELLMAGALLALLAGIVNTANLAVARTRRHAAALATRVALGARGWHVAGQLASEGLLLGTASGLGGLLLAAAMLWVLPRVGLTELPRSHTIALDATTAWVTLATALGVGVATSVLPGLHVAFAGLSRTMQRSTRSRTGDRLGRVARRGLIAVQIATAVILTIAAVMLVVSFAWLTEQDPGFRPRGLTTASFDVPVSRYPAAADAHAFVTRAVQAIRDIPGVGAVGVTQLLPFGGREATYFIRREDIADSPPLGAWNYVVSPGYFDAMQVRVLAGRAFDASDTSHSSPVIIVDETLARRLWPDGRAVGRRVVLPNVPAAAPRTVVGIVAPVRHAQVTQPGLTMGGAAYRVYTQASERAFTMAVRTEPSLTVMPAVRAAVQAIDPHMPLYDERPMSDRVARTLAPRRLAMALGAVFGGTTLLLAMVGIYGVLSLIATERQREFAIRLALGESAVGVVGHVIKEAAAMTALGLTIGLGAGWWLRDVVSPYLMGVDWASRGVVMVAAAAVVVVAAIACVAPARRVARVSPVIVLESE